MHIHEPIIPYLFSQVLVYADGKSSATITLYYSRRRITHQWENFLTPDSGLIFLNFGKWMMNTSDDSALESILSKHGGDSSELIAILQDTQKEFGYLPKEAMQKIARFLKLPESNVFGVATFYAHFKLSPAARRAIKVCSGTACHVKDNSDILAVIEHELGIKPGETTKDLKYPLQLIACFGSCALAPVMVVDKTVYGRMTPEKVAEIFKQDYILRHKQLRMIRL